MINPKLLSLFATVVRAQNLSRAATQLGLSKSVVSRQLARLEEELGARLLQRTTRKLSLTEVGELVLQQAEQVERALDSIDQLTGSYRQQVRGRLRVSCSMSLGRIHVAPVLPALAARYPELEIALQMEDHLVDLTANNIDVALRLSRLTDSSLIARKLADNPRILVAAPSYLKKHGTPTRPQKLVEHQCLLYGHGGRVYDEWEFEGPTGLVRVHVRGQVQMNDGGALVEAAAAGVGVLLVDRLLLRGELERGELVELLPEYPPPMGLPLHAVYPARAWLPKKTAVFIEFMEQALKLGGRAGRP